MQNALLEYQQQIQEAADYIRRKDGRSYAVGIVLGTGLGSLAEEVINPVILPYTEIPNFPESTVKFHAGRLVLGKLEDKNVLIMQGRFHYYEGLSMRQICLPIRVMHALGLRRLILTNAAGGIRERLKPGTIALTTDHINFMGTNPLIGPHADFLGDRFTDMSEPYSERLRQLAQQVAGKLNIELQPHIFAAISGPSFETEAEIKMLQILGADSVGMSVIPEALTARQLDMELLSLTVITDQALPGHMETVSHEQVNSVAQQVGPKFIKLVRGIVAGL